MNCVSGEVYTLFLKDILSIPRCFIEVFHIQQSYILDYPWSNNTCCAKLVIDQSDFYSFDQRNILFLSSY